MERRAVTGTVVVDLAKPNETRGAIKVDLNAVRTGVDAFSPGDRGSAE